MCIYIYIYTLLYHTYLYLSLSLSLSLSLYMYYIYIYTDITILYNDLERPADRAVHQRGRQIVRHGDRLGAMYYYVITA